VCKEIISREHAIQKIEAARKIDEAWERWGRFRLVETSYMKDIMKNIVVERLSDCKIRVKHEKQ
jgi:hypothetical protein